MQPNDQASFAYNYLVRRGLPAHVAAGFVGNFAVESGNFAPDVIAGQRRGDDGSAHYLQQLRGERKAKFEMFAAETGRPPTDLTAQLDFVLEEANPNSKYNDAGVVKNWGTIVASPDANAAAKNVMQYYERASSDPRYNHFDKRAMYAAKIAGNDPSANPFAAQSQQQPAQQNANQPSMYDDPNIDFGALGLMRMGAQLQRRTDPLAYMSAYAPVGATADFASTSFDQAPPNSDPISTDGMKSALFNSGQTQFGIKAARDGIDISKMDPQTVAALTSTANTIGRDIVLNSGYRSQEQQEGIRAKGDPNRLTVAKKSYHTAGHAGDISLAGMSEEEVAQLVDTLIANGFTGIGYYGGKTPFLHADMRPSVPNSFDPRRNWGGWTNLPPSITQVMLRRGYRPGLSADQITRGFQ